MGTTHGAKPIRGEKRVPLSPQYEGRFGRMFRRLPPAPEYTPDQLLALANLMRELVAPPPGGWASAPTPQPEADNPSIPAAYTYFGQFVDHDLTFDPASSLQQQNDPDALHDFRTPRFDLDSLYGSGPDDEPFQYVLGTDPEQLLIDTNVNGELDLPRNSQGIALVGDPRNDENIIVSQLQLTFLRLHNKLAAEVAADAALPAEDRFAETQRRVRWLYQQVVIFDYLPRLVGHDLVDELLKTTDDGGFDFKLKYYKAKVNAYMPVEFSVAAFRFGHSQVRGVYDLNDTVVGRPIFLPGDVSPTDDLRGRRPLPAAWTIQWSHFVDLPGANPQPSRLIDTHLVDGLFSLPGHDQPLPLLNLLRGQSMCLPSGQDVARYLRSDTVLTTAEMGADVLDPTPLWFYVLKEAELQHAGTQLGTVGGRIVAETLLGLLHNDKASWINVDPAWHTTIPVVGDHPTLADVINYANQ